MSYDKAKYDQLRSLKIKHELALALSDDDLPMLGGADLEPLPGDANIATVIGRLNQIIGVLKG